MSTVVLLVVLSACSERGSSGEVDALPAEPLASLEITVGKQVAVFPQGTACLIFDDSFHGSYGTFDMSVLSRGAPANGGCEGPSLSITLLAPPRDGVVVVGDRTRTMTATFPSGALDLRSATLRSHPDWQFKAGDRVRLGWSSGEDLVGATVDVLFVLGPLTDIGPPMPFWRASGATNGDEISFVVPDPSPALGDGTLSIGLNGIPRPEAISCVGAVTCVLEAYDGLAHSATIAR